MLNMSGAELSRRRLKLRASGASVPEITEPNDLDMEKARQDEQDGEKEGEDESDDGAASPALAEKSEAESDDGSVPPALAKSIGGKKDEQESEDQSDDGSVPPALAKSTGGKKDEKESEDESDDGSVPPALAKSIGGKKDEQDESEDQSDDGSVPPALAKSTGGKKDEKESEDESDDGSVPPALAKSIGGKKDEQDESEDQSDDGSVPPALAKSTGGKKDEKESEDESDDGSVPPALAKKRGGEKDESEDESDDGSFCPPLRQIQDEDSSDWWWCRFSSFGLKTLDRFCQAPHTCMLATKLFAPGMVPGIFGLRSDRIVPSLSTMSPFWCSQNWIGQQLLGLHYTKDVGFNVSNLDLEAFHWSNHESHSPMVKVKKHVDLLDIGLKAVRGNEHIIAALSVLSVGNCYAFHSSGVLEITWCPSPDS